MAGTLGKAAATTAFALVEGALLLARVSGEFNHHDNSKRALLVCSRALSVGRRRGRTEPPDGGRQPDARLRIPTF
jgi:hypothetical protein